MRSASFASVTLIALITSAVLGLLLASDRAFATTWTGSGQWMDSERWDQGVPTPLTPATIETGTCKVEIVGAGAFDLVIESATVEVQSGGLTPGIAGTLGVARALEVGYTGNATLRIRTGGRVASAEAEITLHEGSTGAVTVDGAGGGATWTNTGQITVGTAYPSTATLEILNGGVVNSAVGVIGSGNSTGIATVDNSTWTNGTSLKVGDGGTGKLFVQNHATVGDVVGAIGTSAGTSGSGTATVDNATWTNTDLYVGASSVGALVVLNHGTVVANIAYVGHGAGSNGTAKFDNGSWTLSGPLAVGNYGTGKVELHNGSTLTSSAGFVGIYDDAIGSITIDNSTWTNRGELVMSSGITLGTPRTNATLLISNGGTVRSAAATVGRAATATATVTGIRAGGPPSSWTISGELNVGDRGPGTLTVANGGIVSVPMTYVSYHGANGVLNLTGTEGARGVIETGQILNAGAAVSGNGGINLNGGMLRATANQADFLRRFQPGNVLIDAGGAFIDSNSHNIGITAALQGAGALTKLGAGVLTLTGANGYAGLTTVEAGTLLVNGSIVGDALVKSGATLGGTGSISGAVTVAPGGFVSPGSSPGTLTTGALTVAAQAALTIDVGIVSDLIVVNGDLTLAGTLNLVGDAKPIANGAALDIIHYSGALIESGLVIGSVPTGFAPSDFALDFSTHGVVRVRRAASSNASLTSLTVSAGTLAVALTPAFATGTFAYSALAPNTATSVTVTPTLADNNASVTVNGVGVLSGTASPAIALQIGATPINVVVTAQDSSTGTYVVDVLWRLMPAKSDFNGDGRSDVFWRRADGANAIWIATGNGPGRFTATFLPGVAPTWQAAATGDINGDGVADVVWYQPSSGLVAIWLMTSAASIGTATFPASVGPDTAWVLAAVADMNGDGRADLIWRNGDTGQLVAWFMSASGMIASTMDYGNVPVEWELRGAGDFDGDGVLDLLWLHPSDGVVALWLMAPNGSFRACYPGAVGPGTWRPYKVADLDGDGFSDIFWRDEATGMTAVWYIDAAAPSPLAGYDFFVSVPLADWTLGSAGDFNADGRDDLLWYAQATGDVVRWLMNGRHTTPTVESAGTAGPNWRVVP